MKHRVSWRGSLPSIVATPLPGVAPVGYFLSFYCWGYGYQLGGAFGLICLLTGTACAFPLPLFVATTLTSRWRRTARGSTIWLFVALVVGRYCLLFGIAPPGVTSRTMGLAVRLRREYSAQQIRDCADAIRRRLNDGTLATDANDRFRPNLLPDDYAIVAKTELPPSLRGRFKRVYIIRCGNEDVVFAVDDKCGLVCDGTRKALDPGLCYIGDHVHAYWNFRL
jgi:hypothetical protein